MVRLRQWLTVPGMTFRRLREDRCLASAAELSFLTIFALVPAMAVVFPLLAALPYFQDVGRRLQDFVFRNFLPTSGELIGEHLQRFAERASHLSLLGLVVLAATVFMAISAVETKVNQIWRVPKSRPLGRRLLLYWAAALLVPLLAGVGLLVSSYLASLPLLSAVAAMPAVSRWWLRGLVWGSEFGAFFLLYWLLPNRRIPLGPASLVAGLMTGVFEAAKVGFVIYLHRVPTYEAIYGALAAIPLFLFWIYISWVIILFGAELTCCCTVIAEGRAGLQARST
ncbi:MAG: YihY family inner membrane protein [Acidobacteriota bacterium]|nr:YihY family inner membrane protein [Acidobacteriota bacterium]